VVEVLERNDWQTPKIENHVYNRMLKAIGEMAGIKIKLHSHLARHSFATFMLSNDVPIERVGKMLGQKSIRTTQRYAKTLAQDVHDDYDMVARKLKKKFRR
jgi:site-specific recombinase XerD